VIFSFFFFSSFSVLFRLILVVFSPALPGKRRDFKFRFLRSPSPKRSTDSNCLSGRLMLFPTMLAAFRLIPPPLPFYPLTLLRGDCRFFFHPTRLSRSLPILLFAIRILFSCSSDTLWPLPDGSFLSKSSSALPSLPFFLPPSLSLMAYALFFLFVRAAILSPTPLWFFLSSFCRSPPPVPSSSATPSSVTPCFLAGPVVVLCRRRALRFPSAFPCFSPPFSSSSPMRMLRKCRCFLSLDFSARLLFNLPLSALPYTHVLFSLCGSPHLSFPLAFVFYSIFPAFNRLRFPFLLLSFFPSLPGPFSRSRRCFSFASYHSFFFLSPKTP